MMQNKWAAKKPDLKFGFTKLWQRLYKFTVTPFKNFMCPGLEFQISVSSRFPQVLFTN